VRCITLLLAAALTGCSSPLQRFEFTRLCMGVQTRIVLFAPEKEPAEAAAAQAFERLDQLDAIMSDYRRGSELNRLSDAAGAGPVPVSPELCEVLSAAQEVSLASGGAFDVTVGPAVALWRQSRRTGALPDEESLARARALIGWERLSVKSRERTASLKTPGMRLDLGGIAKGYAAERAVQSLKGRGVDRCLVSLAGDVFAGDPPPHERGWRVEVRGEQGSGPEGVLLVANEAVSTSGDTEQFVEIGGNRYSHILDPRTGLGIGARRSVTVVAPRGDWTDALATAACVLAPGSLPALLAQFPGSAAITQERTDAGTVIRTEIDPDHHLRWVARPAVAPAAGSR